MTALKTAHNWKVLPSYILFAGSEHDIDELTLNTLNAKLMLAWQILQDEICKGCGQPIWLAYSTINYVEFEVKTSTCYGCAAKEEFESNKNKNKSSKHTHGELSYVKPVIAEGYTMPTRDQGLQKIPTD